MAAKLIHLEKLDGFRLRIGFAGGSVGVHGFAALVSCTSGRNTDHTRGKAGKQFSATGLRAAIVAARHNHQSRTARDKPAAAR